MINAVKLDEIRSLLDDVVNSMSKKDAASPSRKLDFMIANTVGHLNGYTSGKLREAGNYAKAGSGQVKNKDHYISCMNQSWDVFESDVEGGRSGKGGPPDIDL